MVERIYRRTENTVEEEIDGEEVKQIIPQAKKCSQCGGPLNKGVEVVVVSSLSGYKGTFCSYECSRKRDV